MGNICCVKFQRVPLKFHTKYITHTFKDTINMHYWEFQSWELLDLRAHMRVWTPPMLMSDLPNWRQKREQRFMSTSASLVSLIHWPLGGLNEFLGKSFSSYFQWLMAEISLAPVPWNECCWTLPMTSQHCFRQWFGTTRKQAINWANVDPDLFCHMVWQGHNALNIKTEMLEINIIIMMYWALKHLKSLATWLWVQ